MNNKKRKVLSLAVLLIVALSLFGCDAADKVDSSSADKAQEKTTAAAVDASGKTTESAVTGQAVNTDDKASDKESKSTEKSESKTKTGTSANQQASSKPEKKSSQPKSSQDIKCTISIDCKTLYSKDPDLASHVSSKGVILGSKELTLKKNATVYDALKASGISFSGKEYISKINGLSEKDGGKMSGWIFFVNGSSPSDSCDQHKLKDGDKIQWRYTCNGGNDI